MISELLKAAETSLNTESARLDAELLLQSVLNKDRSFLYSHPDFNLNEHQLERFNALLNKRQSGQPVAYLTGVKSFWKQQLKVNQQVLIPRPETECLIEEILSRMPMTDNKQVLELGTGSGAIVLALASERPQWQFTATDISSEALAVAIENADNNMLERIEFLQSNWFEQLTGRSFDLIVSNPPYIASHDHHLEQEEIRFEPVTALVSGDDGLDAIRHIIKTAIKHFNPAGSLVLEHGFDQGAAVQQLLQEHGYYNIGKIHDLAGIHRATFGQLDA